jgi:hypothetical protein
VIDFRSVPVADGVHMLESTDDVRLHSVSLVNNERVGLLVDVGEGSFSGIELTQVTVSGSGSQLGAIAQADGVEVPETWDLGITRENAVLLNDEESTVRLDGMPATGDIPMIAGLEDGVRGIVGPTD